MLLNVSSGSLKILNSSFSENIEKCSCIFLQLHYELEIFEVIVNEGEAQIIYHLTDTEIESR